MEQMKATYDKLNDNQRQLFETLNAKMQEAIELVQPDNKLEVFTKEMMETYMESGKTYINALAAEDKPENFMETYINAFQKWTETQTASYEKATEFFTNWMESFTFEGTNSQFTKLSELYQSSIEAIWNTTTDNAKLMQGMFFVTAK